MAKKLEKDDILDSFVPVGLVRFPGERVVLKYENHISGRNFWVEYGNSHPGFATLFFAQRYFNKLRKKYERKHEHEE